MKQFIFTVSNKKDCTIAGFVQLLTALMIALACSFPTSVQAFTTEDGSNGTPSSIAAIFATCRIDSFQDKEVKWFNARLPANNFNSNAPLFQKNQSYYIFAFPWSRGGPGATERARVPVAQALDWYNNHVTLLIDDTITLHLADYPHFFSYTVDPATVDPNTSRAISPSIPCRFIDNNNDGIPDTIQGQPTYIPVELITPGVHKVQVLFDGVPLPINAEQGRNFAFREFIGPNDPDVIASASGAEGGVLNITYQGVPFGNPQGFMVQNIHTQVDMANPANLTEASLLLYDGSSLPLALPEVSGMDWPSHWEYTYTDIRSVLNAHGKTAADVSGLTIRGYETGKYMVQMQPSTDRIAEAAARFVEIPDPEEN